MRSIVDCQRACIVVPRDPEAATEGAMRKLQYRRKFIERGTLTFYLRRTDSLQDISHRCQLAGKVRRQGNPFHIGVRFETRRLIVKIRHKVVRRHLPRTTLKDSRCVVLADLNFSIWHGYVSSFFAHYGKGCGVVFSNCGSKSLSRKPAVRGTVRKRGILWARCIPQP